MDNELNSSVPGFGEPLEKVPESETASEQPTPLPSLKAGVTTETFWPKDDVYGVADVLRREDPISAVLDYPKVGRVIPCENLRSVVPLETSLERRVKKLEEQVDGLLQRIADYNFKSQHKI